MSRTRRKPKGCAHETEVQYLNDTMKWIHRRYRVFGELTTTKRVRKTPEEYERDVAAANQRYEDDCRAVRKRFWYVNTRPEGPLYQWYLDSLPKKHHYYVSRYRYETVPIDIDAEIEDARRQFAKRTRDGYCNETGRNCAFKTLSKTDVRRHSRRLEHRIVRDEEWDHLPYPDTYLGKKHIWSVW